MLEYPAVVVGAGPVGVAMALSLRDRGINALVIERGERVGGSWRARYDGLRLNTGKHSSHLPGIRYPRRTSTFPSRDEIVEHLETGAEGLDIRFNTVAERIDRLPLGWRLTTSTGVVDIPNVVVATGYDHTPYIPEWDGAQRSPETCCTRPGTAAPAVSSALGCWWSAADRREWKSPTNW